MIEIMNASIYQHQAGFFGSDWQALAEFAADHFMDGVELLVDYGEQPQDLPQGLVYGVHLPIWITWLDIWHNQPDAVERYYQGEREWTRRYAGGQWRSQMLTTLAQLLKDVERLKPAYAVIHASHVEIPHAFTRAYTYSDLTVLDAYASLLNTVAEMFGGEPPVRLYIENVWWRGLTFADPTLADYFMRCLNFDNWAFVLDTAHLINTRRGLGNERDAIFFVLDRVNALSPDVLEHIEAVHLNFSLSGEYQEASIARGLPNDFTQFSFAEQFKLARDHVGQIDQHRPFTHPDCQRILDVLNPKVVIHELAAGNASALSQAMSTQYHAVHHLPKTEGDVR